MGFGFWEVSIILLIVLVIFGAGKLPAVMGDLAKGVKAFKSGMKDDELDPGQPPAREAHPSGSIGSGVPTARLDTPTPPSETPREPDARR